MAYFRPPPLVTARFVARLTLQFLAALLILVAATCDRAQKERRDCLGAFHFAAYTADTAWVVLIHPECSGYAVPMKREIGSPVDPKFKGMGAGRP